MPSLTHKTHLSACLFALSVASLTHTHTSYADTRAITQTKSSLQQLHTQITQLQQSLTQVHDKQARLKQALGKTSIQIKQYTEELSQLHIALEKKQKAIQALQAETIVLNEKLAEQQRILAAHIRARYHLNNNQPIKWLLNQDTPARVNRVLTYYQYIIRANQQAIDSVHATQNALHSNQIKQNEEIAHLHVLENTLNQRSRSLDREKRQHTKLLQTLNQDINKKEKTLAAYRHNEVSLSRLLTALVQQSVVQTRRPFTLMRKKLINPLAGDRAYHRQNANQGVIFFAEGGAPVRAVYPGKVAFSDWLNGYGYLLIIDHGWGFMTLYANNQSLMKHKGETVNQGDIIARVGHSGTLKQNGLYFEIRHRGKATPPLEWLS